MVIVREAGMQSQCRVEIDVAPLRCVKILRSCVSGSDLLDGQRQSGGLHGQQTDRWRHPNPGWKPQRPPWHCRVPSAPPAARCVCMCVMADFILRPGMGTNDIESFACPGAIEAVGAACVKTRPPTPPLESDCYVPFITRWFPCLSLPTCSISWAFFWVNVFYCKDPPSESWKSCFSLTLLLNER